MSKSFGTLLLIVLGLLVLVTAWQADDANSATHSPATVEVSIVSAPSGFDYGEVLRYGIRLVNRTNTMQSVDLALQTGTEVAPQKGPPYQRGLDLRPKETRIIVFRTMVKGPPPVPSTGGSFCLTVWLFGTNPFSSGAFTCARVNK